MTFVFFACLMVSSKFIMAAEGESASSYDALLSTYGALASIVAIVLGWLGRLLSAFLKTRIKNEQIGGVLARFSDSVFAAVKTINQTLKQEILKARDAQSPGGTTITVEEAARLKSAVWAALLQEYGGMHGLQKFLAILGLGSEQEVTNWVDRKIESAVHDVKKNL